MSANPAKQLIAIGYIAKAHGIRGELAVQAYAESADLFSGKVFLEKGERPQSRKQIAITAVRRHHGGLLITLEGVTDRTQAETLKGYTIYILRGELPEPDENEAYLADILGLQVFVQPETPGMPPELLGEIVAIDVPAGQELWTILTPTGREILLPAVPEFVLDINLMAGQALIAPPPGLLELF